ncbi:MAG: TIGR00282 family metallophosphoesterase [Candidatus Hydrogenedentes bacterium]|nr:TIGR00282 family metallophosphoesterase [Candidatus Hydrogenedentota bacterium]
MRILFLGDIIGKPGRSIVMSLLPEIVSEYKVDMVIANAENSAGGLGATPETINQLRVAGINGFTLGNHIWKYDTIIQSLENDDDLVKPANLPPGTPGKEYSILHCKKKNVKVGIISILGRIFMDPVDCPFRTSSEIISAIKEVTPVIIVDFHAEATAEKIALGWFLDGKCSAVVGTHTHVQTADERILPNGTAYITDVGMCGPYQSVIGMEINRVLTRLLTGMPKKWEVANGPSMLNAVIIDIDESTGKAQNIQRIIKMEVC